MLRKYYFLLLLFYVINANLSAIINNDNFINLDEDFDCPCSNVLHCMTIPAPDVVVLGFLTNFDNYTFVDWKRVTTIAVFTDLTNIPKDLVCLAHAHNVSLILPPKVSINILLDINSHDIFVKSLISKVLEYNFDGVNYDFEVSISPEQAYLYTSLINLTVNSLRAINKNYQVSVDMIPMQECTNLPKSRCYNASELSNVIDYFMLMFYDFGYPYCLTGANSPINYINPSVESYVKLGVPLNKIVIGYAWYGYAYKCVKSSNSSCEIYNNGSMHLNPCNYDRTSICFRQAIDLLDGQGVWHWSQLFLSPFITMEKNDTVYQIWYDDAISLTLKYYLARQLSLRGIGMFIVNCLNLTSNFDGTRDMWNAIDVFLQPN